jgi:hypothetical protein
MGATEGHAIVPGMGWEKKPNSYTNFKAIEMRLTLEQRLQALERENTVLHEKLKILHKLFKEQSTLINDYILQRVSSVSHGSGGNGDRPEDAVYTFICKKRLDRIERNIKRISRQGENGSSDLEVRAG